MPDNKNKPAHVTTYFVNGEEQTTTHDKLTVTQILENAGFTPVSDYSLRSENPPKTFEDLNEEVDIHNHQRFQALFTGPTPVS